MEKKDFLANPILNKLSTTCTHIIPNDEHSKYSPQKHSLSKEEKQETLFSQWFIAIHKPS